MPLKAINYNQTHFNKLVCKDLRITDCYVGHTTDFNKRKYHHKGRCCNPMSKSYNLPVYSFIRCAGGWDNWEMILIKTEKCENSLDARKKRERAD